MDWQALQKLTEKNIEKSCAIISRDEQAISEATAIKYFPMAVARAHGSLVWDADGNRYIDLLSSAAVYNLGHSHPAVVDAVREKVGELQNYTIVYFYNEEPVRLAELLQENTPGDFPKKVTFGFGGSDAVDSSIKAARAWTGRKWVLSFRNSYHGMTYGSMSVTGIVDEERKAPVRPDRWVAFADFPDPYRNVWNIDGYAEPERLTEAAMEAVEQTVAGLEGDVAAILIEPVQGDGGLVIPPPGFLKRLSDFARREGIVFIDEEVQTGMGRSGTMWAIEQEDVVPDLLVSAKSLGGGMPISAVIGREEILESVPVPLYAYTHSGHHVNSAAAAAVIETVKAEGLQRKAVEKGEKIARWFRQKADIYPFIGDIRQRGLLMGVDIVKDRESRTPDKAMALKISWAAWQRGLLLITFGSAGNVLRIEPPLNIPEELLDEAFGIIEASIDDVLSGRIPDEVLPLLKGW